MCDDFIRVWTSVRTVALDEEWAKPSPGQQPETRRRLQPLMCAEPLLNFAETVVIEDEIIRRAKSKSTRSLHTARVWSTQSW